MAQIEPLAPMPEILDFLLSRRSRPAKTLTGPGPDREAVLPMLEAAARSPDHGKLEPWRFLVLGPEAMKRLGHLTRTRGAELNLAPPQIEKNAHAFENSPLCVVVVASPKDSEKVPEAEQTLSAGAATLALLNAALASGWGANWLSGWQAFDRPFLHEGLSLAPHEWVAGYVHIGTETSVPPERPRPDLTKITQWMDS